ncbi:MAG: TIGR04283 family arsenosugar biosynthesis glycosyltransferase [Myxococcota bacterium]
MAPLTPLVVLAKSPEAGRVKTRLATAVGDRAAASLAAAFLRDVWKHAARAPECAPVLALAGRRDGLPALDPPPGAIRRQGGGDLGARMERRLRRGIGEAGRAVLIGADSPGVPPALLGRAARLLEHHDAVLGPSEDGGFWLIGLRRCPQGLLADLPWSTPDTLQRTLERLREHDLSVGFLPTWFDVDDARDLTRLRLLLDHGVLDAPATRATLHQTRSPIIPIPYNDPGTCASPQLPGAAASSPADVNPSIIIPTLNEARHLPLRLRELLAMDGAGEIIVVDGGSTDVTADIATACPGVRLVRSPAGRARQMNAGAAAARGDVLLFLHADVQLPRTAMSHISGACNDPGVVAGAFLTHHVSDGGRWPLGRLLRLADVRSRYTALPYGDQALFVRADAFCALGGFPDLPLMEDLEMSIRLRRVGRVARCRAEVRVSGRRFEARPAYYTTLVNVFPLLYRLGVPARWLSALYRHTR